MGKCEQNTAGIFDSRKIYFLALLSCLSCAVVAEKNPPNILLVLTDDQRADELVSMPTVQELAKTGVNFTQAFVTTPLCTPSRASMLAGGFYGHRTGILSNGDWRKFDDTNTLATSLQAAGYRTGFVGKYLHGYQPGYVPPGWSSFVANSNGGMINDWFNLEDITIGSSDEKSSRGEILEQHKQYVTYFQRDQALKFLEKNTERPFFLMLSTYAPHAPRTPAPEDSETTYDLHQRLPLETDVSDKPRWVRRASSHIFPWSKGGPIDLRNTSQLNAKTLAAVDRSIAALLGKLDSLGLIADTTIIFTSDNGLLSGEHNLVDKGSPYDPAIRVPLIIRAHGNRPASRSDLTAMNLDIPATIYDIAGINKKTDGVSLLPLLNNDVKGRRTEMVIEAGGYFAHWSRYGFAADGLGVWAGFRTQDWKYVEHPTGEIELYHLKLDPDEMENRATDKDSSGVKSYFAKRLDQLRNERNFE